MKNIILGKRSIFSLELKNLISNSLIFSVNEFIHHLKNNEINFKFNLIINSFYSSSRLSVLKSYSDFYSKSIYELSMLLDILSPELVNKIIYTSSSSVYGSLDSNYYSQDSYNRRIYSSVKLASESLITNYSNKNNIKFIICRVFNIYGENENFSFISKILNSYKNKNLLNLNNNGSAIRDFIYIKDAAKIYKKLLHVNISGTYDVGTGVGIKLIDIIKLIGAKNFKIRLIGKKINEIEYSVANIKELSSLLKRIKFQSLENFFYRNKLIKKKLHIKNKYHNSKKNLLFKDIEGSIIYGAGYAGKKLAKSMLDNNQKIYCFVDDDRAKIDKFIFGIKVIHNEDLISLSSNYIIPNIIVAIPSLKENSFQKLYEKLLPLTLNISTLPSKNFIKNNLINFNDIQEVDISNIIGRKIYLPNANNLKKFYKKNILITGGGGSIGSELASQILEGEPKNLIILDNSEFALYKVMQKNISSKANIIPVLGDINDKNLISSLIRKYEFNYIYHAAAFKHVNFLERNEISAIKNNIFGTINIFESLRGYKTNFTLISTDKSVSPKSILGYTKRFSEIYCQSLSAEKDFTKLNLSIVRFGNVFGSDGSVARLFFDQLLHNKPITLTSIKAKRFFMSIKEACNLVIETSDLKYKNSIYVLKMGKQIKIIDLVKKMSSVLGVDFNKIKITGLKKGEKRIEKLSYKNLFSTSKKDIMIAKDPIYNKKDVIYFTNNLIKYLNVFDKNKCVKFLKYFVNNHEKFKK